MQQPEGDYLFHTSCDCGSSDGKAVYTSGTAFCFVCNKFFPDADTTEQGIVKIRGGVFLDFIEDGTLAPLTKRGLTLDTVSKYKYQQGTYKSKPAQIAPYYDAGNNIVAQHIRLPNKDFIWVGDAKAVCLFGQHLPSVPI